MGTTPLTDFQYKDSQPKKERYRRKPTSDEKTLPPVPELPENYELFTDDERERERERKKNNPFKDDFHHYSRVLQYTLNKTTKGEPHRFVLTTLLNIPADYPQHTEQLRSQAYYLTLVRERRQDLTED
eukprot:807037-Amphidinium_carterae.1